MMGFLKRGLWQSGLLWMLLAGTAMAAGAGPFVGGMDNPNVAFLLLLVGVFGLIFEVATPGVMIPGLLGGIAMIMSLSALKGMPVNMSGLAVMLVGLVLILLPLFKVKLSAVSLVGVAVFTLGAVWLLSGEGLNADLPILAGLTLASGVFFQWLVGRFVKSRESVSITGEAGLVGRIGTVLADFDRKGRVMIDGTSWKVIAEGGFRKGDEVKVLAVHDLVLQVERS